MAFVQARVGSTRLPGKVLEPISGRSALSWILERVAAAPGVDKVVVVSPEGQANAPLEPLAAEAGAELVRGSEIDVLDRFHTAAGRLKPAAILRITADCPLVDPELVGELIEFYRSSGVDYASVATSVRTPSVMRLYPDGLDAEIFGAHVLETAWREASDPFDREHVTPFIWRRPERFTIGYLEPEHDMSEERWTVDYPDDLEFVRAVYERLATNVLFGYREVRALLEREPELRQINAAHRIA